MWPTSQYGSEQSYDKLQRGLTLQRHIDERLLPAISRGFIEEIENCVFALDLALEDLKDDKFREQFTRLQERLQSAEREIVEQSRINGKEDNRRKILRREFARSWARICWILMQRKGLLGDRTVREVII